MLETTIWNPNTNPNGCASRKHCPEHDLCSQGGWRWFKSGTTAKSCFWKSSWQRECWELSARKESGRKFIGVYQTWLLLFLESNATSFCWLPIIELREIIFMFWHLDCQLKVPENSFLFLAIVLSFASSKPFFFFCFYENPLLQKEINK